MILMIIIIVISITDDNDKNNTNNSSSNKINSPFQPGVFSTGSTNAGEYIGVSSITGEKVAPSINSAVCDYLYSFVPFFDIFSIAVYENKKCLLEIKENLLIMRNKSSLRTM